MEKYYEKNAYVLKRVFCGFWTEPSKPKDCTGGPGVFDTSERFGASLRCRCHVFPSGLWGSSPLDVLLEVSGV